MRRALVTGFLLLFVGVFATTANASGGGELFVSPSTGVYPVGEVFTVKVLANTDGQAVNAIEGELAYNPSDFSVEAISTEGSILSSFSTPPSYDGAAGIVHFSGWAGTIYNGKDGLLVTLSLRPLRATTSGIRFNTGAMLAADGKGSNIITTMRSGGYTLRPRQVETTPVAPLQEATSAPDVVGVVGSTATDTSQLRSTSPGADAAALPFSGMELAPLLFVFFLALVLVSFGIAYVLHKITR